MMTGMINNVFFIIFPILIYQMFATAGKRNFFKSHKAILTALFSVSIILCMVFPYRVMQEEYIFDLRQVPLVVGALYGGPVVSAVLFLVGAAGRIAIGGDGMYMAVLTLFVVAIGVPLLRPLYMRINRFGKVALVFVISIVSLSFNMLAGNWLFGNPIESLFSLWLMLMLSQGAVTAIAALLIEHIQRQEYLLNSLMKHEKLETVSHFAASVSHELRNPIQSIQGFVQLMKEHEYSRAKQIEFYDTILNEITAADQLIEDYLVFAKPASGKQEVIQVKLEIQQVLKVLTPYANWEKVTINLIDGGCKAEIMADRQKFHQMLINIIRNGIDAMPGGGVLTIRIKEKAPSVLILLKDEGVGMSKEELQRLGEPYFSTKSRGTGLGMMVSYSIAHQLGGEISVQSEKGKGSVFTLEFPLAK
ncbi:MAG TPA: HAMP domain-containing sensor histidine kinase [Planococcus sp. (in: firmicutes)]|nr:HAMP domain-containing sensor histidine kinase [Planococcus sp. (in: firmicutes)]